MGQHIFEIVARIDTVELAIAEQTSEFGIIGRMHSRKLRSAGSFATMLCESPGWFQRIFGPASKLRIMAATPGTEEDGLAADIYGSLHTAVECCAARALSW